MSLTVKLGNSFHTLGASGATHSAAFEKPSVGATVGLNLSNSEQPKPGYVPAAVGVTTAWVGVSVNVAFGQGPPQLLGGGALQIGPTLGGSLVGAEIPLPPPGSLEGAHACAKIGTGCQ